MKATFHVGDSLTVLRTLPAASVDLVVTSPPFLALRSYLPDDHPDKASEMGSEPTPGEFLDALLDVIVECRRVLAPHGSICVELGDTYSGSGGSGGDYTDTGTRAGQEKFVGTAISQRRSAQRNRQIKGERHDGHDSAELGTGAAPRLARVGRGDEWPLEKSVCLIPESFRFALAYGRNPFTGREIEPWRVRNVVRWCRPNPPVGALGDKFRPATSDIAVACISKTRYFDLDAVRAPSDYDRPNLAGRGAITDVPGKRHNGFDHTVNPLGAPPLDWWKVSTKGFHGSHYATYPPELIDRLVQAMCPPKVCLTCGEPSRRIVEVEHVANRSTNGPQSSERKHLDGGSAGYVARADRIATTTGWTDCGHDNWRNGVVLDPFAGSGTTLAVATGHGHDAIGIDLDERNLHLARERVGMFLVEAS